MSECKGDLLKVHRRKPVAASRWQQIDLRVATLLVQRERVWACDAAAAATGGFMMQMTPASDLASDPASLKQAL